ncbi:MAG: ATP-dependent zinc metalloprotease FtsH [Pseudomonadota bacterium]
MSDKKTVFTARRLLLLALVLLLGLLAACLHALLPQSSGRELRLDELEQFASLARIENAVFLDEDARVKGSLLPDPEIARQEALLNLKPSKIEFWTSYPRNDVTTSRLIERLTKSGARVEVDPQNTKGLIRLFTTTLMPILILVNLFALLFVGRKDDDSAVSEVTEFGKSDSAQPVQTSSLSFKDVAGADDAVVELREVVDYLKNPGKYEALGAVPPKGVLLFGPPGCGKTLLARAVAGEAGVNFFSVSGAEFVESLVGVGAARVRNLFAKARAASPAIVFIDEIDAAGRRRSSASAGGSEEREQTLIQLLVEMDGFSASSGIVVMAATNRPDVLDPALMRPGRFDRHVTVDRPDIDRRQSILKLHLRNRPVAPGIDVAALARQTPGFTGADLANVVNEALLLTIRANRTQIDAAVLSEAVQRVIAGPKRGGHLLSEDERRRVAYHESGHAVVAMLEGMGDSVHRLSIVARSRGLGAAQLQRQEGAEVLTQAQLEARLCSYMAGRETERLVFGDISTGSEGDLSEATKLARDIVGRYAMSDAFGGMRLLADAGEDFLGGTLAIGPISGTSHATFDAEIKKTLLAASARANQHVSEHRQRVDRIAQELLARESIEGAALAALLESA